MEGLGSNIQGSALGAISPERKSNFLFYILVPLLVSTSLVLLPHCQNSPNAESLGKSNLPWLNFEAEATERAILNLIRDAKVSIEMSLYGLENEAIVDALIEAHQDRGIQVRLSSEFDSASSPSWQKLVLHGLPLRFGNASGIMHNKYIIIDRKYLLTGSANLTEGLFKHFNNVIILNSPQIANQYLQDFEVQFSGYYASKKDNGYDKVIGGDTDILWDASKFHIDGGMSIRAYFTPYKDSFAEYTENPGLPICGSTQTCLNRPTGGLGPCENQNCEEQSCYAPLTRGRNKIVHSYLDYDKQEVLYCAAYDNAMNQVIPLLREAKHSILILAFSLRDRLFQHELIRAKQERGVEVKIWIDSSQYKSGARQSALSFVKLAGVVDLLKVCRKPDGGLLHHKVIVVDDNIVVLGSMNFSRNAVESNDENFLIIEDAPALSRAFYREATRIDQYSYDFMDWQ